MWWPDNSEAQVYAVLVIALCITVIVLLAANLPATARCDKCRDLYPLPDRPARARSHRRRATHPTLNPAERDTIEMHFASTTAAQDAQTVVMPVNHHSNSRTVGGDAT